MTLKVETFVLGPIENNTYLVTDLETGESAIVDPASSSNELLEVIQRNAYPIKFILITHAHFDHLGGVKWLKNTLPGTPQTILHQDDASLWESGGGAREFGFDFEVGSPPDILVSEDPGLALGKSKMTILHTPGHTPGHVTFYFPAALKAFCGDLIFFHGIGRTDLSYGNEGDLFASIREVIFSLPTQTVLYPGHGPATTVGEERKNNPFLTG